MKKKTIKKEYQKIYKLIHQITDELNKINKKKQLVSLDSVNNKVKLVIL